MTITNPTITVDPLNHLPHGTVKRAPTGFAHAILLDQMGQAAKWYVLDLYGPMGDRREDVVDDQHVADWPIVYVPAPDEVWKAMTTQPSCRDMVAEEFGSTPEEDPDPDQEWSSADPHPQEGPTSAEGKSLQAERMYPISAFVVPCQHCEHKQWIHSSKTGECHGGASVGDTCECPGFEEAPIGEDS